MEMQIVPNRVLSPSGVLESTLLLVLLGPRWSERPQTFSGRRYKC